MVQSKFNLEVKCTSLHPILKEIYVIDKGKIRCLLFYTPLDKDLTYRFTF